MKKIFLVTFIKLYIILDQYVVLHPHYDLSCSKKPQYESYAHSMFPPVTPTKPHKTLYGGGGPAAARHVKDSEAWASVSTTTMS